MADFYKCCWMWIPCLDQGHGANVVDVPVIRHYFDYIRVHGWTLSSEFSFATDSVSLISFKAQIPHPMPIHASGRAGLVQALGFKCIICNAEFASRRAADCHCRHPASCGMACADPSNMLSLSLHNQIHQQELKTNQGATMMTRSLHKKPSLLLCYAMQCRVEDGDADSTIRCFCWASSPTQYCAARYVN